MADDSPDLIDVYITATGEKVRKPAHFLSLFPGSFARTPKQKATDKAATKAATAEKKEA